MFAPPQAFCANEIGIFWRLGPNGSFDETPRFVGAGDGAQFVSPFSLAS